jgi:hypothetical protein
MIKAIPFRWAGAKRFSESFYVFGIEEAVKVTRKHIHFEHDGGWQGPLQAAERAAVHWKAAP